MSGHRGPTGALVLSMLVLAACSFDLAGHPAACSTDADCDARHTCYRALCVAADGTGGTGPGTGGEGTGGAATGDGDGDGSGGGGGGGGGGTVGDGDGSGDGDGDGAMTIDAGTGGMMASPPDYGACTDAGDCNPGDACRTGIGKGVCAGPCSQDADCPLPPGTYEAAVECTSGQCRLNCAAVAVPPVQRSCPQGYSCANEIPLFSCFPD